MVTPTPIHVNQILCSPRAREFAARKLFPDDVVCCGPASLFISYTDPGLKLSQAIRRETLRFVEDSGILPRVILLENHGVITVGRSSEAVKAAMFMIEKAAKIFVGAAALGDRNFFRRRMSAGLPGGPMNITAKKCSSCDRPLRRAHVPSLLIRIQRQ